MKTLNTDNLRLVRADLLARLEASKREAETISRDIEALDRMLERYGAQIPLEINDKATPVSEEFSGASLRVAVTTVLKRHFPRSVKVPKIKEEILAGGYKTSAKNLSPPIFVMLSKLVKGGKVRKVDKGLFEMIDE